MKAEGLELAAKRIEEVLKWGEKVERLPLGEIEGKVLGIREERSVKLAEAVINAQAKGQGVPGSRCEACQAEMRYKDHHGLRVTSWVGELRIERGYYYCARCKRGFFPLDDELGIRDKHWSESVVKEVVWLSAVVDRYGPARRRLSDWLRHD